MSAYEDIAVGDRAELRHTVTEDDVRRFVEMTGDDNPLHVDRDYAETTPFKDIVVHGMFAASLVSTVIGTRLPGDGALWVSQTLDFALPVRLGDELTVSCTVLATHDRERLLELEAKVLNQHGQTVLSGAGKVKVLERAEPAAHDAPSAASRVAIVTGGAGGIGRAVCVRLAADGYKVVVNHRGDAGRAQRVVDEIEASGGEAMTVRADVAVEEEAAALVERATRAYGGVGLLVHNASPRINAKGFDALTSADLRAQLDVGLHGALSLAKACVPGMRERGHGRIVTITSQVLDGAPPPTWTAYAVGKAALATFSRHLAAELGPSGITVNCVAPGMTDTRLVGDLPEKQRLITARQTPLRRLAEPEDVAGAVAYLASDAAAFVTGETLRVNGGQAMR